MAQVVSLAFPAALGNFSSSMSRAGVCSNVQGRTLQGQVVWRSLEGRWKGRRTGGAVCMAESGCCGASGGGGGCGGSSRSKDAEAMLAAAAAMQELERSYDSAPMTSSINKEIIQDVISSFPDAMPGAQQEGEKFLDINQLLAEASALSNGDLVFEDDGAMV